MAQWKCTCSSLSVRSKATTGTDRLGYIYRNAIVNQLDITTTTNGEIWIQHDGLGTGKPGWSQASSKNANTKYLEEYTSPTPVSVDTVTENSLPPVTDDDEGEGYRPTVESLFSYNTKTDLSTSNAYYTIKDALAVHGLPYQFMPHVDPRITDGGDQQISLGGEYAERIIARMPLLLMTPGSADFMTKFGSKQKESVLEQLVVMASGNTTKSVLDDMMNKEGRYYTFKADTPRYYNYVNPMCRIAARYMEVQGARLDGVTLDRVDWYKYTGNRINTWADIGDIGSGSMGAVPFYINSDTSITDSFSNSTTESMLGSTVNSIGDYGRELKFLLGYAPSALEMNALTDTEIQSDVQNVQDMVGNLLGKNSFLTNLSKHVATVATGGKLTFPEIWSDSSFSRSYSVNIKLVSPDADKLSVYFNIMVPLMHLLAFVAPQSLTANPNGYTNPFLVRGIYKGMFNIDMGIITDMTVTKGSEGMWTLDGIPTTVDINFTVKDLYDSLAITDMGNTKFDTLNNTALMDYIANSCGVNIYKPEISRAIDMWMINNFDNRIGDYFRVNLWGGINNTLQNTLINRIYRRGAL